MTVVPDHLQTLADMCIEAGRLLDEVANDLAAEGLTNTARKAREASVSADGVAVSINDYRRTRQP